MSVASATNIRKLDGSPLATCPAGGTFSFIADFHIVTTSTARENIGMYFQTAGGSSALTGTCSDNIISPPHDPGANGVVNCGPGTGQIPCLGSALYHEFDTSLVGDNCGDTTSADGTNQIVTVEVIMRCARLHQVPRTWLFRPARAGNSQVELSCAKAPLLIPGGHT